MANSNDETPPFERLISRGIPQVFKWVEWTLVIGAVQYVYKAHNVPVAGIVGGILTALMGLHIAWATMSAIMDQVPREPKHWVGTAISVASLVLGLSLALAINIGLKELIVALVASEVASS